MSSVNKAILVGNLGADPEVRQTQSGQAVATLSLATSKRYTDKQGQQQERTEWHRVVCWGKLAELAERFLAKGRKVFVEGEITTRSWDDPQTGQKKYATEIVARDVVFLDSGRDQGGQSHSRGGGYGGGQTSGYGQPPPQTRETYSSRGAKQQAPTSQPQVSGYGDDDIPF